MKKILSILLLIVVLLTGCTNSGKYNSEPFKYIVMDSHPYGNTLLIKIGMNDTIIQSNKSKRNAMSGGSFMEKPQFANNKAYFTASTSHNSTIDYGILSVDPYTLVVDAVPGLTAATCFYIDKENIYTSCAYPPLHSVLTKSKITDSQKSSDKFSKLDIQGILMYMFMDDSYLYTIAYKDPEINAGAITVTKIDTETLKPSTKYIIPDSTFCTDVLITQTDIFFAISGSTETTMQRDIESFEGYIIDPQAEDLSEIYRLDKKTNKLTRIDLPFDGVKKLTMVDGYLYAVSRGDDPERNSSLAKINISTNKIEKAINLPYFCCDSYITNNMLISLDKHNIYEHDLNSMKILNTIKLSDDPSVFYNSFFLQENIKP